MKGCELCAGTARMYCESDQASLCFECDGRVHGANFLVARHSRVLLCRTCQAPTPWKAAGPRLAPTVSLCDRCCRGGRSAGKDGDGDDEEESRSEGARPGEDDAGRGGDDQGSDPAEDDDDEDDDDEMEEDQENKDEEEEEEEEEGEEQVVPWSAGPPPVASSSSSEGERIWGNVDRPSPSCSQDQLPCSSLSRPRFPPNRTVQAPVDDEATSDSSRRFRDCTRPDRLRSGSHQFSA